MNRNGILKTDFANFCEHSILGNMVMGSFGNSYILIKKFTVKI